MRIISGEYKKRHIPVRKNFPSRPTTDFAKENIFNVIGNFFDFQECEVLDMFSGTGSISYEFASRGSVVDLIENDLRSVQFIKKVIADLGIQTIKAYHADVFRVIGRIKKKYDLVFADPPYSLKAIDIIPRLIFENQLLKPGGWFILEHSSSHSFTAHACFRELRKYGSVHFSIFSEKLQTN